MDIHDINRRHGFRSGACVVAVRTCSPSQGGMRVGVASTRPEAERNLKEIPIEGYRSPWLGLAWVISEGEAPGSLWDYDRE